MDLKKLTDKAKDLVEKRGGTDSVKEDAEELKGIASSKSSFADKAKAAVEAIKDPGDEETARPAPQAESPLPPPAPAPETARAEGDADGERHGGHGHGGHGRGGQGRGGQGRGGQGRGRGGGRDEGPAV